MFLAYKKPRSCGAFQNLQERPWPRPSATYDTHELAILRTLALEPDVAVFLGEKRVIATDANINARVETCTALANNDVTSQYCLPAVDLDA